MQSSLLFNSHINNLLNFTLKILWFIHYNFIPKLYIINFFLDFFFLSNSNNYQ